MLKGKQVHGILMLVFLLVSIPALWALFCPQCGRTLPDQANFCPGCGSRQSPTGTTSRPTPPNSPFPPGDFLPIPSPTRPSSPHSVTPGTQSASPVRTPKPGEISDQDFLRLFARLDQSEQRLRMDHSAMAQNRQIIQDLLLPEVDRLRKGIKQRELRLTRAQAKLLNSCQEMYNSILQGSIALGYRKDIALAQVEQAVALKYFLRNFLPEIDYEVIPRIEECSTLEQKNIYSQIVEMNREAGFESTGVGYLIKREAISNNGAVLRFSLLLAPTDHKVGQRLQVFSDRKKPLGSLRFKKSHGPYRHYEGDLPLSAFDSSICRSLQVEYAVQSRLDPRWKTRHLTIFLMPHFRPQHDEDFVLDATFGPNPGISRQKFLASLGLFGN